MQLFLKSLGLNLFFALLLAQWPASICAQNTNTFFQAKSKAAKQERMDAWLDAMLQMAKKSSFKGYVGVDFMKTFSVGFRDDVFKPYFGKPYFDLSNSEKSKLHDFLKNNYRNPGELSTFLTIPFRNRKSSADYALWQNAIAKVNNRHYLRQTDLLRKEPFKKGIYMENRYIKRVDLPKCEGGGEYSIHNVCDKILEMPEYDLYWSNSGYQRFSENRPCYVEDGDLVANVSVILKNFDHARVIEMDEKQKKRINDEILKAIHLAGCNGAPLSKVHIAYYVQGVVIPQKKGEAILFDSHVAKGRDRNNLQQKVGGHLGELPLCQVNVLIKGNTVEIPGFISMVGKAPISINSVKVIKEDQKRELEYAAIARKQREDSRLRQLFFEQPKAIMKSFGIWWQPALELGDKLEELALENNGVAYSRDIRDTEIPSITICNQENAEVRIASMIEWAPRQRQFDSDIPSEIRLNGWAYLKPGDCRAIRLGAARSAFLCIEIKDNDGKFRPYIAGESVPLSQISINNCENRAINTMAFFACADNTESFSYIYKTLDGISECIENGTLKPFFLFVQNDGKTKFTLTIKN